MGRPIGPRKVHRYSVDFKLIGLGERLIYYGNTFLITHLYAVILSVLLIAVLTSQLAQATDRALIRWK